MTKRKIRVFIASPGDLTEERQAFREAVDQLNAGFADGANVEFESLGWEDTLASTGRRNQSVINEEIDKCDVFILTMYRRWGQHAPDAKPYGSYTEEEFHRALERWRTTKAPEIFVFFKRVDAVSEADAGPQLKQVIDFRKQLEETRQVMYHYYDDPTTFKKKVDDHLRAYAKGELPRTDRNTHIVILPTAALEEVEQAKELAEQKAKEAESAHDEKEKLRLQFEAMQLQMAEDAARLSREGKIEFAREKMTQLVSATTNLRILALAYEFFYRTGDLDTAFLILEQWLASNSEDKSPIERAAVYCNLGNLYSTRSALDRAEEMYQKSLVIYEALGRQEGMAAQYGNLGILYTTRGEWDRAEEMYNKALEINEALGRKEEIASSYGNVGNLYTTRGELDRAEDMYNKSLAINEELGSKEGMAINYSSLGILHAARGNLDRAEDMYKKSLAIEEGLGHQEGMASSYCNLGSLYKTRGELDRAEDMYKKSLAISEVLGRQEGIAMNYGNLGILYAIRGDLDRAEDMYKKSLAIEEGLGHQEGIANQYGNLGILYAAQGDSDRAEDMYKKSLAIDERLGRQGGMANQYGNLGNLYAIRGELDRAAEMYQKSLAIFRVLRSPHVVIVQKWLEEIGLSEAAHI